MEKIHYIFTGLRLPSQMMKDVDELAKKEKRSRNKTIERSLERYIEDYKYRSERGECV